MTEDSDKARLAEIRAREAKASDPPWFTNDRGSIALLSGVRAITGNSMRLDPDYRTEGARSANDEFCACAREDIPYLLALVDRLVADIKKLRWELSLWAPGLDKLDETRWIEDL